MRLKSHSYASDPVWPMLGFRMLFATKRTVLILTACSGDTSRASELDRVQLRTKLHQQLSGNTTISSRESWQVIASGSESPNNTIRLFYMRTLIDSSIRASGKNQNLPDYWNREHVWPQSYGLRGSIAARDLHNIVPVDRTVNTSRSNKFFDMARQQHHECSGCRTNSNAWEPPNPVKGDVARILFYMETRYDGDGDEPDLKLSDSPDKDKAVFGRLSTLYQWHCRDPVGPEEVQRHDLVAKAQGNRNRFVDEPDLAQRVYGFVCNGT